LRTLASFILFSVSVQAWAGRPLFTDDANLTTEHACQFETWWQKSNESSRWWALPACSPFSNFEITFGANTNTFSGTQNYTGYLLQGKTLFKPINNGDYGAGLAFGAIRTEHGLADVDYVYLPISFQSGDGNLTTNINLGWTKNSGQNQTTWGIGSQYAWNKYISSFGEIFGNDRSDPTVHLGISIFVIPNYLQLDATYGRNMANSTDKNFYTLGFDLFLPAF
jgi:hypothetical protein